MSKIEKRSDILFSVYLDDEKFPQKIEWQATDSSAENPQECKAVMLSIWDSKLDEALRIDLWTKEMHQDEMDRFFFQTFILMADTYHNANNNEALSKRIKDFAFQFGEATKVIKRKSE